MKFPVFAIDYHLTFPPQILLAKEHLCFKKRFSLLRRVFFLGGCDSFAPIPGNWSCPRMMPPELSDAIPPFTHDTKI